MTDPGADHGHAVAGPTDGAARRALWIALVLNLGFLGVEVAGGVLFSSLALLADAAHMVSDVVGLAIALIAQRLTARPATSRYSFGFRRAEALGAQFNGVALLAVSLWLIVEAVRRLGDPGTVEGGGLLAVALAGLAVNVISAVVLARGQAEVGGHHGHAHDAGESASRRNLNLHGAFLHMAADAASSLGVVVAAVVVLVWGADWADPAVSLLIGVLVLWSVWTLLRDTTNVLLEATPEGVDPESVRRALDADPDVSAVHHLHLWQLDATSTALSAHVVVDEERSLHQAQVIGDRLRTALAERFDIDHATLELECHPCDDAPLAGPAVDADPAEPSATPS